MISYQVHQLRTWRGQFAAVIGGWKRFEYRKNDRDFQIGDTLLLREWLDDVGEYTRRKIESRVTYILHGPEFGIPDGYCVMSIEVIP